MSPRTGLPPPLLAAVLLLLAAGGLPVSAQTCDESHPYAGFRAAFRMHQHQLRGEVEILDSCSFVVRQFEMIHGPSVYWWVAGGVSLEEMASGQRASSERLVGTFNGTGEVVVRLAESVRWDDARVLAVWDEASQASYGSIPLVPAADGSGGLTPAPLQPTHFDNCMDLAFNARLRWSLVASDASSAGGATHLEMAIEHTHPHGAWVSVGAANPEVGRNDGRVMVTSDASITGYGSDGIPYAVDYYLGEVSVCYRPQGGEGSGWQGVCTDSTFDDGQAGAEEVMNVHMLYAHYLEGVTLVRFRRPLVSPDKLWDHDVPATGDVRFIWAHGQLDEVADPIGGAAVALTHGVEATNYGDLRIDIAGRGGGCAPLAGLGSGAGAGSVGAVVAEPSGSSARAEVVVAAGDSTGDHPNPPAPARSLYVEGLPTPILRVAEGTTLVLRVEAGEDNPVYLTTSAVGGPAGSVPGGERVLAGGDAGVAGTPGKPGRLEWVAESLGSSTPIYYQSRGAAKMGWTIEVERGLGAEYDNSAPLAGGGATLHWTLGPEEVSYALVAHVRSNWLSLGFGPGMTDAVSYVAWFEENDGGAAAGRLESYCLVGKTAGGVERSHEAFTSAEVTRQNGRLTMKFTRPLGKPAYAAGTQGSRACEGRSTVDAAQAQLALWAVGESWNAGGELEPPIEAVNTHNDRSSTPTVVDLRTGGAKAKSVSALLVWHGVLMFLAWGVGGPLTALSARYLKPSPALAAHHMRLLGPSAPRGGRTLEGMLSSGKVLGKPVWLGSHMLLAYATLAATLVGYVVIFVWVEDENGGVHWGSDHNYLGTTVAVLAVLQPLNGYFRPGNPPAGRPKPLLRTAWELGHRALAGGVLVLGAAALLTGLEEVERFGAGDTRVLWGLCFVWMGLLLLFKLWLDMRGAGLLVKTAQHAQHEDQGVALEMRGAVTESNATRNRAPTSPTTVCPVPLSV